MLINPSHSSFRQGQALFPIRVYLADKMTPYSLEWYEQYRNSDIGSAYSGSGGDEFNEIHSHECYGRLSTIYRYLGNFRMWSVGLSALQYCAARVMRQVSYYGLYNNPNIDNPYYYLKHVLSHLDLSVDYLLADCIIAHLDGIDAAYGQWPNHYAGFVQEWWEQRDISQYNAGMVRGLPLSLMNQLAVYPYPQPPQWHMLPYEQYTSVWGFREASFDHDWLSLPYPLPENFDIYPELPEVITTTVPPTTTTLQPVTTTSFPTTVAPTTTMKPTTTTSAPSGKDDKDDTVTTVVIGAALKAVLDDLASRYKTILLNNSQLRLLVDYGYVNVETLYQQYLVNPNDLSVSERQILALYNKIDYGEVFSGKSRR